MIIERNLSDLVIDSSSPILDALTKITRNKARFIVCTTALGHLEGVLTDGDFRRWAANEASLNLALPVGTICNRSVVTVGNCCRSSHCRSAQRPDSVHPLAGSAWPRRCDRTK
jgi:hypothetical protein